MACVFLVGGLLALAGFLGLAALPLFLVL